MQQSTYLDSAAADEVKHLALPVQTVGRRDCWLLREPHKRRRYRRGCPTARLASACSASLGYSVPVQWSAKQTLCRNSSATTSRKEKIRLTLLRHLIMHAQDHLCGCQSPLSALDRQSMKSGKILYSICSPASRDDRLLEARQIQEDEMTSLTVLDHDNVHEHSHVQNVIADRHRRHVFWRVVLCRWSRHVIAGRWNVARLSSQKKGLVQ